MSNKLTITRQQIIDTIAKFPKSEMAFESLFPDIVHEKDIEIKVGTLFIRKGYNNFYALIRWNGFIRFLNITFNSFWNADRQIKVSALQDKSGDFITLREFKQLLGTANNEEFTLITYKDGKSTL